MSSSGLKGPESTTDRQGYRQIETILLNGDDNHRRESMLAIIGMIIVTACVAGGFAMAHGPFAVLWQPAEFVTIGGAAVGSLVVATPKAQFGLIMAAVKGTFTKSAPSKGEVTEVLQALYGLLGAMRKNGLLFLEKELKEPHSSEYFKKSPTLMKNHHALDFLVDALQFWVANNAQPDELDAYLYMCLDTHEEEAQVAPGAINKVADALPALGIVAAVLGIIITMQSLDQPPEVLGHHVGAALVGTFLGVLMSYGYVAPLATLMSAQSKEEERLLLAIKSTLVAFADGSAPATAVEIGRTQFYSPNRPSGPELLTALRGGS